MSNTITLNVTEYLENAYPSLTDEQIDLIASDVSRRWDYSWLTDNVDAKCRETASYANIPLRSQFNTEYSADVVDNEAEGFPESDDDEGLVHSSEGC